ncbi:hypothetical protein JW988_08755 [Candidatus Bathyarchaeota archaeon]|nr:hypothetical protein [Candidatus Bathyarchaeota archaeon]
MCGRAVVIVCWRSNSQSVIEEKGEGFENGKILLACWMRPSTSNALLTHHKTYDIINI